MSSKFIWSEAAVNDYEKAISSLLTIWGSLQEFEDDIVLVGGLAVFLHTAGKSTFPFKPVTTSDVDIAIDLATETGQYDTLLSRLQQQGFIEKNRRLVKEIDGRNVYLDFLSENGSKLSTQLVSDITTSSFPGIQRALNQFEVKSVQGIDSYGSIKTMDIKVASVGPLMVLKLQSFAMRAAPKDAYDFIMLVVESGYPISEIVRQFYLEQETGNPAFDCALKCLTDQFGDINGSGPLRVAHFLFGEKSNNRINVERRIVLEKVVSVGLALKSS